MEQRLKKHKKQNYKESKKRGFRLFWQMIENDIQSDQRTIPGYAFLLSSSSQYQGHFMRTGAGIEFMNTLDDFIPHINKEGKKVKKSINREEHTSPVTALGKYLFLNAVKGTLFDGGKNSIFDKAMKAYFQGSLPKFMDDRLKYKDKDGKMVYDYSSLPPLEHLTDILNGDISIWARYFHPNVNNNFTTDLDSMTDKDMANGEHLIGEINHNDIV